MYKKAKKSLEGEHSILNESAKKRSGHIAIKNENELLKEDPRVVRIDGIRAKETPTIMGGKI